MAAPGAGPPQARHSQSPAGRETAEPTSPPHAEKATGGKHAILYAWEFGANLGHIGTFLPLAQALRERGHTVHWVVAHPHQAARLLPAAGFAWLQAPLFPELRQANPPINYADILLRFGYGQAADLLGPITAWRELLRLTRARLVLADHAPGAILAARTLGVPVMLFGSGFFAPPQVTPTPNLRPWLVVPEQRLAEADAQALSSMNAVLARFGQPPLESVAALFRVAEDTLLTFPELDHYASRGPARYWGTLPAAVAAAPVWPDTSGPRVFAYLRPESAHFVAALEALHASSASVLIFAPGAAPAVIARFGAAHLAFATAPVDLNLVARQADAGVTYASPAATIAFLLAGKPVLMLPGHLEQFLFAQRVVEMGAGLLQNPEQPPADLPAMLARVIHDPGLRANAVAFADKYRNFDQSAVLRHLVQRIEELAILELPPPFAPSRGGFLIRSLRPKEVQSRPKEMQSRANLDTMPDE
ncbi:MAG: UDP-glucuronosyltransferase [Betaproteobacteria bacterium HGW-Betaproteobacteria-11]|nr:MAG: UDP-glucuronosyltransferase [Betaproteobacteria bacterium HGW-Betaproteobacteria-11]